MKSPTVPGSGLLHPVALAALGLLLVNDHALKAAYPGLITGKLSDIAGLIVFPLLVVAGWEAIVAAARRWHGPSPAPLHAALIVTGVVFTLVKTTSLGALSFGVGLGLVQAMPGVVHAVVTKTPLPAVAPAAVVADPTDLVALPALAVALVSGRGRADGRRHHSWSRLQTPMSGRRLVVRQALALMALGIALFATAATSATTYDQAGGTEGNVTLTAASPIVVRHLHIVVPTGGQKVTVTGRISVSLGPKRPEPITFEIVRDADGATLALSPLNESIAAIGRRFTPFEQCGPDDCEGDFTVTLRLIGGDVGTVGWSAGVAVHFPAPAGGDTIPTVVITE